MTFMSLSPQQALDALGQWIVEQGMRHDLPGPAPDADLMDEGWIDSLGLMGLISHIEDLLARPLEDNEIRMHHFSSLSAVVRQFFAGS
jgi:acyl carrier protein